MLSQIGSGFLRSDFVHEIVPGFVVTDVTPIEFAIKIHSHVLQFRGAVGRERFNSIVRCAPFALLRKKRLIIGAVCQSFGLTPKLLLKFGVIIR